MPACCSSEHFCHLPHTVVAAGNSNSLLKHVAHPCVQQAGAAGAAEFLSAAAAAALMQQPGLNFVPAAAAADFMSLVQDIILGTDMAVSVV